MKKGLVLGGLLLGLFLVLAGLQACLVPLPQTELERQGREAALTKQNQLRKDLAGPLQTEMERLGKENSALKEQNQLLKDLAGPLPASLDNLFPPKAPAPVFLLEMFSLEAPVVGIIVDLQEGDIPGVQANSQAV